MSNLSNDISIGLKSIAGEWKKEKLHEERLSRSSFSRWSYRTYQTPIRDYAFEVMEEAINKASGGGRYYANARQIMYAARPLVLEKSGGRIWKSSAYFTQNILKDWLERNSGNSRVVWDSRGKLTEPHTLDSIPLGGSDVIAYEKKWTNSFNIYEDIDIKETIETKGYKFRYNTVLFIEKEGFEEIFEDVGLAEKYDMAIMSTKGVPVAAACNLCSRLSGCGVKILVLRDFDLAGFKILNTLRRGTRMASGSSVIDLGLGLEDINKMGLASEPVDYRQNINPERYLKRCGATEEECKFLVSKQGYRWSGNRVELNAMTSDQLIEWLEGKLKEYGAGKVVPEEKVLVDAYKRAVYKKRIDKEISEIKDDVESKEVKIPKNLTKLIGKEIKGTKKSWDRAIWDMAEVEEI